MTEYKAHPAADLFPMMEGEDFDKLIADIKANGLRERIVLLDNRVLDGRNRLKACEAAGVKPEFLKFANGDPEIGDPLRYVISKNLHRRHLDTSQRSMIAVKLANMRQGERTDLEPSGNSGKVSQAEAAQFLNVSTDSVQAAKVIQDHGSPELQAAVTAGEIPVSRAAETAKTQTHDEQRETVKEARQAKAARAAKPRQPSKGKPTPKGPPVEHKGEPDNIFAAKVELHFAALWKLSVDCHCPEIRDAADAIERALIHKGYLPKLSERQRDPKAYLARLKPPKVQSIEKREAVFRGGPDDGKVVTYLHGPADADWDAIRKAEKERKH